jgi:hypothetical protein
LWRICGDLIFTDAGAQEIREVKNMSISTQQTHRAGDTPSAAFIPKAGHFYRFYSIDVGGRIALAEDHECENDSDALAFGEKLLAGKSCPKMEVWLRKVRVGVIESRWSRCG